MQRTILLFISCLPFGACSGYHDGHDDVPDASTTFPEPGICGNGILDVPGVEECDDGNSVSGDGCSASCALEDCRASGHCSGCGNGVLEPGELCDDGNSVAGDGCSAMCTLEGGYECNPGGVCMPLCGDGIVEPGEMCDDGNATSSDGCSATCTLEECGPSGCGPCGDGVLQAGEVCDDGNATSGDGCVSDCTSLEDGFGCPLPGQPCLPPMPTEH